MLGYQEDDVAAKELSSFRTLCLKSYEKKYLGEAIIILIIMEAVLEQRERHCQKLQTMCILKRDHILL